MNIINIIEKKVRKEKLSKKEIEFFVEGYKDEDIPDYQIASLLMAIRLNHMDLEESTYLTEAIVNSGRTIKHNTTKTIIDKHSTGGVGDKTSLVLVPLFASLGFMVSKMSGRGLGFTGGTIDKLESIEGFDVELDEEHIIEQVNSIGCIIVSQNDDLVPADKKLYALRDVTATVDEASLIAASIMSKKIALGAQFIVLDVKYGNGGFMKTKEEAEHLARLMIQIGLNLGKKIVAFITSMEQPLGKNIGNALEVQEAIDTLRGKGNAELRELCTQIAKEVLVIEKEISYEEAHVEVEQKLNNLEAFAKFQELIKAQGAVDSSDIKLEQAKHQCEFKMKQSGFIKKIYADKVGLASLELGAGRKTKEDKIDLTVGIELLKKVGDRIEKGETIAIIHYNDKKKLESSLSVLELAYEISEQGIEKTSIIESIIK